MSDIFYFQFMEPTVLKYFDSPYLYEDHARVLEVKVEEDGKCMIILDESIFYPQGGGQPYDQGTIKGGEGLFKVESVRFVDGFVHHYGVFLDGTFHNGDDVFCVLDVDRRSLNGRLHSAGHLIDCALEKLGYQWKPLKGYHFPDGPYVEYEADISDAEKEKLIPLLQAEVNRSIGEGAGVTMRCMDLEELRILCKYVPDYLPANKPSRAAIFHFAQADGGDRGIQCGGNKNKNLRDIGMMIIPKIKAKKGVLRVSYLVE